MSLNEHSREVLRAGRGGEGPSADDRERVRRKLELAVAMQVPGPDVPAPRFASPSGWASSNLFVTGIASAVVALGVVGSVATRTVWQAPPEQTSPAEQPAVPVVEPLAQAALVPEPIAVDEEAAEPAPEPRPTRVVKRKKLAAPPVAREPLPTPSVGAGPTPNPEPVEDTLEAETRGLKEVHTALKAAQPTQALGLLDQQDRRFPQGQLRPERAAARVIATCAVDAEGGAAALARFQALYPASPLLARLKTACVK